MDLFAQKYGPELFDVSNSDYKYIQKIDWTLYTNPAQYFSSEREYIIGSLIGRLNPELSMLLPTLQDVFKIKESGTKFKTKLAKHHFIKTCSEQLKDLPYNSTQLNSIKNFLREKAHEYGIKLDEPHTLDIDVNYLRNEQTPCPCVDCHSVLHLLVTNTLLHPDIISLGLQTAISHLNNKKNNEDNATFI